MKGLRRNIFLIFLLFLLLSVLYSGTGCGQSQGSGSWHIADSLAVSFEFPDNVEHQGYYGSHDIIRIMLPNYNYHDTLYYVLKATIYGIDNSTYTVDENLTKWVTINNTFTDMNMKIIKEGSSIINYSWQGGMEFVDTLKIVRLSDENGISASGSVNSAFSFKVAVYNNKTREYEYYQKDFDIYFKKLMRIEVDLTNDGSAFLDDTFSLDNIFANFKYLINDDRIIIDVKMPDANIPDPPAVVDTAGAGWDELMEYSHSYHNSALYYENYQDTSDEFSIEVIFFGSGGITNIGYFGVTNLSNGNYRYYRANNNRAYNNPIFLNIFSLYNLIMYNDQYYWTGEIGIGTFNWGEFEADLNEALGTILAHEIGHNVGRLLDESSNKNAKNQGLDYNVMYVPDDSTSLLMACYLDRYFDVLQIYEMLRISQFYFKGNNWWWRKK